MTESDKKKAEDKKKTEDKKKAKDTADKSPEPEKKAAEESQQDPWADAVKEEGVGGAQSASGDVFKQLDTKSPGGNPSDLDIIMDIPVKLSVELGRTQVTIKQLLELAQGSVVELDGLAGEPMDIMINGYLIAQGEVVVLDDKYGIRITEIVTPSERVQKLNR